MRIFFLFLMTLIFMITGFNDQAGINTLVDFHDTYSNDLENSSNRYAAERIDFIINKVRIRIVSPRTLLFKTERSPNRYSLKNLIDKNKKSAWVTKLYQGHNEDSQGDFKLEFNKPVFMKSFILSNGYQQSPKTYSDNQRVKKINIFPVHIGGPSYPMWKTVELPDQMEPYKIDLIKLFGVDFQVMPITKLIFAIDQVYEGNKYKDICISEVKIDFFKKPSYKPTISWEALKANIETNITYRNQTNSGWDSNIILGDNKNFFYDLMYYAMNRNKEAQKLFVNYKPVAVMASESMSNIYLPAYKAYLKLGP